jgi:LPS-assembly protein
LLRLLILTLLFCWSTAQGQNAVVDTSPATHSESETSSTPAVVSDAKPNVTASPGADIGWGSCAVFAPPPPIASVPDGEFEITSGRVEFALGGDAQFNDQIQLSSGNRRLTADSASYDRAASIFTVDGAVEYRDPETQVLATNAQFNQLTSEVFFKNAKFQLWSVPARGSGAEIKVEQAGKLRLQDVSYTSCPENNNDWLLRASKIRIDQNTGIGTAKHARLVFKGVPILYFPYISYPASNQRKTGWLIPDFGNSQSRGVEFEVPFYWNIAPQMDATIAPRYMSKRGLQIRSDFRYLTAKHDGVITAEYLPDDDVTNTSRGLTAWEHQSQFTSTLRGSINAKHVSDSQYFEDLSSGLASTSQTHLLRRVDLDFFDNAWSGLLRFEDYQTIDDTILPEDYPYQTLPKLAIRGFSPNGPLGLQYGLDGEVAYFDRNIGVTGVRAHVMPEIAMPLSFAGVHVTPAAAYDYTAYQLNDQAPEASDNPSRNAPILSVNMASTFERLTSKGKWLQTLEPRVLYTYIPNTKQDDLPVFDTIEPTPNIVQLFRKNRFVGYDRLGDTDQLAIGITTRLINATDGDEFLKATIGETLYFSDRDVILPGGTPADSNSSDYLFEFGMKLFEHWRLNLGYQYNSDQRQAKLADARLHYRSSANKLASLSYRYRRDTLEEIDISAAWPVAEHWNLVGRYDYSILDQKSLERLAGVEYETCCWAIRSVWRRNLVSRTGDSDTSISLQLILKGFGSSNSAADRLLDRGILDYD